MSPARRGVLATSAAGGAASLLPEHLPATTDGNALRNQSTSFGARMCAPTLLQTRRNRNEIQKWLCRWNKQALGSTRPCNRRSIARLCGSPELATSGAWSELRVPSSTASAAQRLTRSHQGA